ncbi:protein PLASTID MOVEMENT IMPAIRED 1-RELATED 1 [Elaeis guineensis]|uniref:Protein PLASTID MOVEMENT IMPAIRED 1-RELATED 1 n=1 Tax=Elaeis guineensis var. tenera TaxID=51953 RepID=A0A6I9S2Q8_ELAGV|nr:protein PLASTID MOVEMENT IMPAIRED 1-RELATED 1 [Elaeis guineensis]
MLGKPVSGKRNAAGDPGNARFLHEIEALSKALSLDPKNPRRALPPSPAASGDHHQPRSVSAGRSHTSGHPKAKPPSSSRKEKASSSFWSWKPLRALSHIGRRRFDCRFSLTVHSVEGVPPVLADAALAVLWKRTTDSAAAGTRSARVFHGVAEFEETLTYRCPVYGTRSGPHNAAKYESRHFLIYVTVVGAPGLDLGKNLVDLTKLLPDTLEELEEEGKGFRKWSTSFRLSGKAKGASLNVSFECLLVRDGSAEPAGGEKKISEFLKARAGKFDRQGSVGQVRSQVRSRDRSRSVEDVKVLHEVLPSSKSEASVLADTEKELECGKFEGDELSTVERGSKSEHEVFVQEDESKDLKPCTVPEPIEGNEESPKLKTCISLEEILAGNEEKEGDEPEFSVIEQGIEIASKDQNYEPASEKVEPEVVDDRGGGVDEQEAEVGMKPEEQEEEFSHHGHNSEQSSLDATIDDLASVFHSLSILESDVPESPQFESKPSLQQNYVDVKSSYKTASIKSKSRSLDDVTESVASEFLNMLGVEHSPFGLSSDSDPESPRERLWKQFEKESLTSGSVLFGLGAELGDESNWDKYPDNFDFSPIVHEAETELQKATQVVNSKSRVEMLEDAETEALMRQWGLDEKVFQDSPPGSRSGFGSPIHLPPEEPLDLPPLGEDLGPFIQTKDGGFLRSMNPALFRNAKNNGSVVMQVSSPIVVPAEMGSEIMEILQRLASVGIEKLSMQASKLMPLEDVTGKTMQQIAWEAAPALEACERQDLLQHQNPETESRIGQNAAGRRKKGKGLNLASSGRVEMGSEYVSLEDLAPLAMDKIEALSIEGLRIQSGMSDEEAPSNISPKSIGEISALEGKGAKNSMSLGLEGTAGLQLLDVKGCGDDIDGLMGLSLTLDEWMRLDSGIVDEEDQISDRTSKILAAHHATSMDLFGGGWKGDKKGGKRSGRRWGLLGNNFTVALMVQLRDPLRNYEPVGTPMLALIQVERVFVPPKPKIYSTVSEKGNSEQDDEPEPESKTKPLAMEEKNEEEDVIPQFKIKEVHVAGLKTEPEKRKVWGNPTQQQSGSRWLLASGMGKSNKHPFMKSKAVTKPSEVTTKVQPGDTLWSISSRVHGTGAKWKDLAALNPHIRNPNIIFPNETIRLH